MLRDYFTLLPLEKILSRIRHWPLDEERPILSTLTRYRHNYTPKTYMVGKIVKSSTNSSLQQQNTIKPSVVENLK